MTAPRIVSSTAQADYKHGQCTTASANLSTDELIRAYLAAKRSVVDSGYAHEVAWQAEVAPPLTPQRFVQEASWVILCTGMSEAIVSRLFPRFVEQLGDLSPEWLVAHTAIARSRALCIFGHEQKIDSILRIAERARILGSDGLRCCMQDPEPFLVGLPYIGPVTWRHLAKNLGAPLAKADRHLRRFAAATGRPSVDELCAEISSWLGDPIPVVDIVLWRWSVLHARSCDRGCSRLPVGDGHQGSRPRANWPPPPPS